MWLTGRSAGGPRGALAPGAGQWRPGAPHSSSQDCEVSLGGFYKPVSSLFTPCRLPFSVSQCTWTGDFGFTNHINSVLNRILKIFLRDFMNSKEVVSFLLKTQYHPFILNKNCFQVWNQYFTCIFFGFCYISHLTPLFLPALMLSHCILADECIQVFLWPWTKYLISFPVSAEVLLSISLKHPPLNPSHIFHFCFLKSSNCFFLNPPII